MLTTDYGGTQKSNAISSSGVLFETGPKGILNIVMSPKINSAPGIEGVSTDFLKLFKAAIVPVISHLANFCFAQDVFPTLFHVGL